MSDNPLAASPERDQRIRNRAYHLWESDGCPEGRSGEYWERAEELTRMADSGPSGLLPNPETSPQRAPVDEAQIQDNYGEFPDRSADQGDRRPTPMTRDQLHAAERAT